MYTRRVRQAIVKYRKSAVGFEDKNPSTEQVIVMPNPVRQWTMQSVAHYRLAECSV